MKPKKKTGMIEKKVEVGEPIAPEDQEDELTESLF